jgi:hypothetical protein
VVHKEKKKVTMAQSKITEIAILGGIAGAGYFLFKTQLQAMFPQLFGPGIATSVLTAASQAAYITAATAAGQTATQIQATFNALVTAQAACAAPNVWSAANASCTGAAVPVAAVPVAAVPVAAVPVAPAVPVAVAPAAPVAVAPAAPVAPAPAATTTTRALLLAWATPNAFYQSQGGLMNGDQWGYGYQVVRGIAPPDPLTMFPGQDRAKLLTIDEYLAGITSSGLSGIRRVRARASSSARSNAARRAWGYS